jgi:RNA polymerase sigma-70 factor, ECF subfamily
LRAVSAVPEPDANEKPSSADKPAFREIFAAHLRFVWRVVSAHGVRPGDAEDASQEVFLIAHRRYDDWDPARAAVRTWLYGIAVRVAANHRRLSHVRHETPGRTVTAPRSETDPVDAIDQNRALEKMYDALAQLDPSKRDVFVLFELEELTMKEVAQILGCPLQTAYTRLHVARRRLAEAMGGNDP